MLSLPIPDKKSPIAYNDIIWENHNLGEIVESITKGKIASNHHAHLDPDLNIASIPRHQDWQPLFGQIGSAQGHLRNQKVGPGDLLLFFGLFQDAMIENDKVKLNPKSPPKHVIWGWFQIEKSLVVDEINQSQFKWALYHPHFHRKPDKSNTLYFPKGNLDLPGLADKNIFGSGIFSHFSTKLQLTANEKKISEWKLPLWMFPTDKTSALTYHGNLKRWEKYQDFALLQTVGRGQEFVFDCLHHEEAIQWLSQLLIT